MKAVVVTAYIAISSAIYTSVKATFSESKNKKRIESLKQEVNSVRDTIRKKLLRHKTIRDSIEFAHVKP